MEVSFKLEAVTPIFVEPIRARMGLAILATVDGGVLVCHSK